MQKQSKLRDAEYNGDTMSLFKHINNRLRSDDREIVVRLNGHSPDTILNQIRGRNALKTICPVSVTIKNGMLVLTRKPLCVPDNAHHPLDDPNAIRPFPGFPRRART